jgi:hypothetical protein
MKALAIALLLLSTAPVLANTNTTPAERRAAVERQDNDDSSWGLLGLVGLCGLAGLLRNSDGSSKKF